MFSSYKSSKNYNPTVSHAQATPLPHIVVNHSSPFVKPPREDDAETEEYSWDFIKTPLKDHLLAMGLLTPQLEQGLDSFYPRRRIKPASDPSVLNYGKRKGERIEAVAQTLEGRDYLKWMLKKPEFLGEARAQLIYKILNQ